MTIPLLGQPKLKNITERFQVYALLLEPPTGVRQTLQIHQIKLSHRMRPVFLIVAMGLALVTTTLVTIYPHHSGSASATRQTLHRRGALRNISKDPEQGYCSDGITEVPTSDLSRVYSLFVIARNLRI